MTTIVGVKKNSKITLYSDSQATNGIRASLDKEIKVTKIYKGVDLIVASTGTLEEASLMEIYSSNHSIGSGNSDRILSWLDEFGTWKNNRIKKYEIENHYIIAHRTGLFKSYGLSVIKCNNFTAMGSGAPYALSALHLGKSGKDAVKFACKLDIYSGGKIKKTSINI